MVGCVVAKTASQGFIGWRCVVRRGRTVVICQFLIVTVVVRTVITIFVCFAGTVVDLAIAKEMFGQFDRYRYSTPLETFGMFALHPFLFNFVGYFSSFAFLLDRIGSFDWRWRLIDEPIHVFGYCKKVITPEFTASGFDTKCKRHLSVCVKDQKIQDTMDIHNYTCTYSGRQLADVFRFKKNVMV